MSFFEEHLKLLKDSLLIEEIKKDNYYLLRSFLPDNKYWNLIAPTVSYKSEVFIPMDDDLKKEKVSQYDFSLYINDPFLKNYKKALEENTYHYEFTDTFLMQTFKTKFTVDLKEEFIEVGEKDFPDYLNQTIKAFPNASDEERFTIYFYQIEKSKNDKEFHNFIIKNETDIISFGSLIFSKELNLGYLHNSGTNEKYRRKGYFLRLNKLTINYLLDQGINRVYAITEEGGGSYNAFMNMGFEIKEKYHIYSK